VYLLETTLRHYMEVAKDNTVSESMNDIESASVGYKMKQILLKLLITIIRANGEEPR
jgi:hypothetical protein